MAMRENIRDLSLEEIYNDYRQLKAIDERYFHCGNSIVYNKAAEALMALLKEEITKRKLEWNNWWKWNWKILGYYKNQTMWI